jgi:hypothetical protein
MSPLKLLFDPEKAARAEEQRVQRILELIVNKMGFIKRNFG